MNNSVWYYAFLGWLAYGGLFAGLGVVAARFVWEKDRQRLREIGRENERLRQERNDLERKLRAGREP
jgi:hypothetical protein